MLRRGGVIELLLFFGRGYSGLRRKGLWLGFPPQNPKRGFRPPRRRFRSAPSAAARWGQRRAQSQSEREKVQRSVKTRVKKAACV
jgi:hypothetical protein